MSVRSLSVKPLKRLERHDMLMGVGGSGREYRVHGNPTCFCDFIYLLEPLNSKDIVWITDTAFVSKKWATQHPFPGFCVYARGCVSHQISFNPRTCLYIYANLMDDAIANVLRMERYGSTWASLNSLGRPGEKRLFRFDLQDSSFAEMAQQFPKLAFRNSLFNAAQLRILANCEDLAFTNCDFWDGGRAIWQVALEENKVSKFGWKRLQITGNFPFSESHLEKIGQCCEFEEMHWEEMQIGTASCRFLVAANIKSLSLYWCEVDDDGQALFQSIYKGKGPQELKILSSSMLLDEFLMSLASAVGNNSCLRHLWLGDKRLPDRFWKALCEGLPNTKGLVSLHISSHYLDSKCDQSTWDQFMGALSTHPTLRTVALPETTFVPDIDQNNEPDKIMRTRAVANMLQVNSCIDDIPPYRFVHKYTFDEKEWAALVEPRLEHNKWRHRFRAILEGDPSTLRAALVGRAIPKLQGKPGFLWLLLCQNADVIGGNWLGSEESRPPGQE